MDVSKFVTRVLAVIVIVVVIVSGIVGIYRGFINPKYLKIKGVKIPTQDVMAAYYQMNPGVPKNGHVSRENAIEAFVLRQQLFRTYLEETEGKWFDGVIIDQKEAYTTQEQQDEHGDELVRRYLLDTGTTILCVYTQDISKRFAVGSRVKVKLGTEFTMLANPYQVTKNNRVIWVRFASELVQASFVAPVHVPAKVVLRKPAVRGKEQHSKR